METARFPEPSSRSVSPMYLLSHAPDFGHAVFKTRPVFAKIVADQFAFPALQKVTSMLTSAAGSEVLDHNSCFAR